MRFVPTLGATLTLAMVLLATDLDAKDLERVSVAFGLGLTSPNDFGANASYPAVGLRVRLARSFLVEAELGRWEKTVRDDYDVYSEHWTKTERRTDAGLHLIFEQPLGGRARGHLGAGLGHHSERFETTSTSRYDSGTRWSGSETGWRLLGGLDLRVAGRVRAFGTARYDVHGPAQTEVRVYGGLRFGIGEWTAVR